MNDQLAKLVPAVLCVTRVFPPEVMVFVFVASVIVQVPAAVLFGFRATISNPFFGLTVAMLTLTWYVVFTS
ncbi:hypothetical protein D3C86_1684870 [compost metagenome]